MFSWQSNASKVALVTLANRLARWAFPIIDAQVATPNTLAMGAEQWPRARFLDLLKETLDYPTRKGSWSNAEPELVAPSPAIIPSRESRRESG